MKCCGSNSRLFQGECFFVPQQAIYRRFCRSEDDEVRKMPRHKNVEAFFCFENSRRLANWDLMFGLTGLHTSPLSLSRRERVKDLPSHPETKAGSQSQAARRSVEEAKPGEAQRRSEAVPLMRRSNLRVKFSEIAKRLTGYFDSVARAFVAIIRSGSERRWPGDCVGVDEDCRPARPRSAAKGKVKNLAACRHRVEG